MKKNIKKKERRAAGRLPPSSWKVSSEKFEKCQWRLEGSEGGDIMGLEESEREVKIDRAYKVKGKKLLNATRKLWV